MIIRLLLPFLLFSCSPSHKLSRREFQKFQVSGLAQGTSYAITYYASELKVTKNMVDSIFYSIDQSLSIYNLNSIITKFNNSDSGIEVDTHFQKVISKSLAIWKETGGLFDITVYPLVEAWGFGLKSRNSVPDSAMISSLKNCIGSDRLKLMKNKLLKEKRCIKIDVNGIAQGYTVDIIAEFLQSNGIRDYLVELGGEIRTSGKKKPGNESIKIGIESPGKDEFEISLVKKVIELTNAAITTAGNYRKYYESGGKNYSHHIDPRSGYPVQNELISVSVIARDAMTADVYDNVLMVLGLTKGFSFVEKNPSMAAHFIFFDKNGIIRDTVTSRFPSWTSQ